MKIIITIVLLTVLIMYVLIMSNLHKTSDTTEDQYDSPITMLDGTKMRTIGDKPIHAQGGGAVLVEGSSLILNVREE